MSKSPPVLKVKAIRPGIHNRLMREHGEVFILTDEKAFSHRWMEPIGWQPEGYKPRPAVVARHRRLGEGEALREQNAKLLARIAELEALLPPAEPSAGPA